MRLLAMSLLAIIACASAWGQFDLEESHTAASLRGIHSLGNGVAWASGADGTVRRTEDGGYLWQICTVPADAEDLDFRAVQGFDANTAVVMSSGKGSLSRVFRTTDGCQTWKQVFRNTDADGFFDSMLKVGEDEMYLLGDPVDGSFAMFYSGDQGATWAIADDPGLDSSAGDGAFAASNSSLIHVGSTLFVGVGGTNKAGVYKTFGDCAHEPPKAADCPMAWKRVEVPMAGGSPGTGIFSLASRTTAAKSGRLSTALVAVGGNYEKPEVAAGSAAYSKDGGGSWLPADALPGGYRSAVAFDNKAQVWLAVGPNGADLSIDNGQHWKSLAGSTTGGWNAISLPFVVGVKGRIGKIRDGVLKP